MDPHEVPPHTRSLRCHKMPLTDWSYVSPGQTSLRMTRPGGFIKHNRLNPQSFVTVSREFIPGFLDNVACHKINVASDYPHASAENR